MTALQAAGAEMDALVLRGIADLVQARIPVPAISPGQVLVRIAACGVCGSDIPRIFTKGTYHFPTVCGHEFAGVIVDVGADVANHKPGERVAVFPLIWCGRCDACEHAMYGQCRDYNYLGSRTDGGFAEYVAAPSANLVAIPGNVTLDAAAMTEPAAVALHALNRAGHVTYGDSVVIFGAGPIGLLAAQWARIAGLTRVVIVDVNETKLKLASRLGFSDLINPRQIDPVEAVSQLTSGSGATVSIDAAGVPAATVQALRTTARGGTVVLLGNPSEAVTIPADVLSQVMRREITIVGTWNSSFNASGGKDDWRRTLEAMAAGALNVEPLITHRVAISEGVNVIQMMKAGSLDYTKVLITPGTGDAS